MKVLIAIALTISLAACVTQAQKNSEKNLWKAYKYATEQRR